MAYDPAVARMRLVNIIAGFLLCGLLWLAGRLRWEWIFTAIGCGAILFSIWLGALAQFAPPQDTASAAGAIAILLPLQAASVITLFRQGKRFTAQLLGGGLIFSVWLLLLTDERSAWMALGIGAFSAVLYAGGAPSRWRPTWRKVGYGWIGILGLLSLIYIAFLIYPRQLSMIPAVSGSALASRAELWRQMIGLAGDYRFTGSGLGMTAMVASSYLFLLHVPLYYHAHNIPIQIGLEQGIFGVVGFVGMTIGVAGMTVAVRRHTPLRLFGACGLAALTTVFVHGLLDSELYANAWVAVLFLPYGYIWGLYALARRDATQGSSISSGWAGVARKILAVSASVVALLTLIWVAFGGRSAWYANLGAVVQTRAELSVYRWPDWGLQDQVRRRQEVTLQPALAAFGAALAIDPKNETSHRRLGQIALSQGNYALAYEHLLAAYTLDPNDRAVRQLLGESYAITGDLTDAARLWETIDLSQGQLELRRSWHESLDEKQAVHYLQEAIRRHEAAVALP